MPQKPQPARYNAISRQSLSLLLCCLWLFVLPTTGWSQRSKTALERERRENQQRISEAAKILEQTATQKNATLGELNALNQQLQGRMQLVKNLSEELDILVREIEEINEITQAMQADREIMRNEYAAMVYHAAKHKANSKLMFLIASESFNQFWSRLRYLKEFREARMKQISHIKVVTERLSRQKVVLQEKTREQTNLLSSQLEESKKLEQLQNQQQQVVKKLSARERELKQEIDDRRDRDARLERLINDMIRREMRRAAKAARERAKRESAKAKAKKKPPVVTDKTQPAAPEPEEEEEEDEEVEPTVIALSTEGLAMSKNFSGNRRKLMWPVESGFIAERFGKHPHPVIKHVMVDNLGVDIQTKSNQAVRSVFDGEIGFVASVPGAAGKIVSVMHGDYITVYCNVVDVRVDVGQRVKMGQLLGQVASDKDGVSTLQFQVWRNQSRLDPEDWLRRR